MKVATTLWSEAMLPMRRIDSDTGRAMWLMSSMGSMSGDEPRDRPEEVLEVREAVLADAVVVRREEDEDRERDVGLQRVRRR